MSETNAPAKQPDASPAREAPPPRPGAWTTVLHVALLSINRGLRGKRLLLTLLIVIFPALLCLLVSSLGADPRHQEKFFYSLLSVFHLTIVIPGVALTLATVFPWPEAEEGTLTYWFTAPVWRWAVLLGRYLASVVIGSMVLPVSFLGVYLSLDAPAGEDLWPTTWAAMLVTWLAFPSYLAIFGLLSAVFRKGIIFGVIFMVIENTIGIVPGMIQRLTVVFYERAFIWQSVPSHMRRAVDEAYTMDTDQMALQASDALMAFTLVPVLAFTLSAVLIHMIEYRAKQGQSA